MACRTPIGPRHLFLRHPAPLLRRHRFPQTRGDTAPTSGPPGSYRRASARSTSMMRTSSSNCCPASGIGMVRDDCWMAATGLMRDLEIRRIEGENSAAVDLFDPRHATKVLAAFGRAYGTLPEASAEIAAEQKMPSARQMVRL